MDFDDAKSHAVSGSLEPSQPASGGTSGDIVSELLQWQADFRQTLSLGCLPVDTEIKTRGYLAFFLMEEYERSQQTQHLRDAIDHYEAIVRRLPPTAATRPEYFDRLSYTLLSEYMISKSRHVLERLFAAESFRGTKLERAPFQSATRSCIYVS